MPTPGASPWREPEHDELADLVRAFFAKEVLPHTARVLAQGHPDREHYRRAGELGLLGLSVPAEYGGGGRRLLPRGRAARRADARGRQQCLGSAVQTVGIGQRVATLSPVNRNRRSK
ncbi:hypothetical protein GCM10020358_43080 [Amorphoplanes nipponensis]|uniref:acyl-CoA dehydrogenase family protein n=1 Tax=Actinoplanes nipponensis TaxID=135950 RepID=UPI0031EA1B3C